MAALTGRMLCHIPPASLQARQARATGLNTRRQGSWRTQTRWRRPQTLATAAPVSPPTSPFANVEHEAQLFAILKAGTASGKVRGSGFEESAFAGLDLGKEPVTSLATPGLRQVLSPCPLQIPQRLVDGIMELYDNYKKAVVGSGKPGATEDFVAKVRPVGSTMLLLPALTQMWTLGGHSRPLSHLFSQACRHPPPMPPAGHGHGV